MKLIVVFLIFINLSIYAQDSLSYSYFDKKTYELYTKQNWKELITLTKQALDKNYNSYYLQMRIAIAYYERKNYVKATKHFEAAREYNINPTLREYLYYSYLFSGYSYKAEYYSNFFSDSLKNKLVIKNHFLKSIDVFAGSFINNDANALSNYEFHNPDKYISSSIRYKNKYNTTFGLGFKFSFSNHIKAYINYSYLNENKTQITKTNTTNGIEIKNYSNNTKQSSYYFNLKYLSNNFSLTTALNILKISDNYYYPEIDYGVVYKNTELKSSEIIFGINMQQKISNFELGLRGTYSNLNSNRQFLAEVEVIYYPLGNKNLYLIASTGIQNIAEKIVTESTSGRGGGNRQSSTYSTLENNNITKLKLGFKTFNFLWIEAQAYLGRINEYNETNGFIVYNDISPITSQYRINLISPITEHLSIFVKYMYNTREQYFYNFKINPPVYPEEPTLETKTNNTKINNSSIIGGIKWTF